MTLTADQEHAIRDLCRNYHTEYIPTNYGPAFDLPEGWVIGWIGPIYCGIDPEGNISS